MKITNPSPIKEIGDPFILKYNKKYYLYATSRKDGFSVWHSKDLKNWSNPTCCYQTTENSFGESDFWAPEVVRHQNKFIMHYTARWKKNQSLRIGIAVADNPLGPFKDLKKEPMFDLGYACIDAHVFQEHGDNYLYFVRDCSENIVEDRHESHIYVARLNENMTQLKSEPIVVLKPDTDWETHFNSRWRWVEGPFMIKNQDDYHLMYSTNCFDTKYYSICVAHSKSPFGPFQKYENNPLVKFDDSLKISGPGHNCVIKGPNNQMILVYHTHTNYDNPSGNRQMCLDKIAFQKGLLVTNAPTLSFEIEREKEW